MKTHFLRWGPFVAALVILALAHGLAGAIAASQIEPGSPDVNNLISDDTMTDVLAMSSEQIETFLRANGPGGGPSPLSGQSVDGERLAEAIYQNAWRSGVNPRVLLTLLEMDLQAVTSSAVSGEQVVNYLEDTGLYFNQVLYAGSRQESWPDRGAPLVLDDGQVVYPENIATAAFYLRYPSLVTATRFVEIWTAQFAFGDLQVPATDLEPPVPLAIADIFSFPMGSPRGQGYWLTQEFNVWNSHYGKWHAGEDWTATDWSSAGDPVYAVANGYVLHRSESGYPGGVLLLKHTLANGNVYYSMYGHITPQVSVGTWVTRGQRIASIYDQGGNSHLHFEIRTVEVVGGSWRGPGYWPSDPRGAGYLDPTGFIARHGFYFPLQVRVINTSSLNVRESPSLSAPIVGTIPGGQQREAIARQIQTRNPGNTDGNVWYKVRYDPDNPSRIGWSIGVYFKTMPNGLLGSDVYLTEISGNLPDNTPPTTVISFSGTSGENGWYTSAVEVTLTATDNSGGSGVKEIKYQMDDGSWQTYAVPFTVGDGRHTIGYRAEDNAGNLESARYAFLLVDTARPTGSFAINNGATDTYATLVRLDNVATDVTSGIWRLAVRNNGEDWSSWGPFQSYLYWLLPALNRHFLEVEVKFQDYAGNESSYTQSVYLNLHPPRPASAYYRLAKSTLGMSGDSRRCTEQYCLGGTSSQPSGVSEMASASYRLALGYWRMSGTSFNVWRIYLPSVSKGQ